MKKNLIALSVAAMVGGLGLSTVAHADVIEGNASVLSFTGDGVGHALLIPYYTVQNGNVSVFSIINTDTVNGKAVKVRFRGASNSDDVFDFQVYMSPGDVFTGAVSQGSNGTAQFTTADNSCTLPTSVNQSFVTTRLSAAEQVGGAGTREGYIEIFTMADIPPLEADLTIPTSVNEDADTTDANALFTAIKHVNGVAPCGLATGRLSQLLSTNTDWFLTTDAASHAGALAVNNTTATSAHRKGMDYPTGSLIGGWTIINVAETLTYSGSASTLVATDGGGVPQAANIVFWPQRDFTIGVTTNPLLTAIQAAGPVVNAFTADPLLKLGGSAAGLARGGVEPRAFDLPDMSTAYTTLAGANPLAPWVQAFNLSAALAVTSITNEFATDAAITASTDWVFSMPSRRYNAAVRYNNGTSGSGAPKAIYTNFANGFYADGTVTTAVADGFSEASPAAYTVGPNYFVPNNTTLQGTQLCVLEVTTSAADRNETFLQASTDFVISPSTPGAAVAFCGEASVLSFNAGGTSGASVLGAALARQDIDVTFTNGWATLGTPNNGEGLPVLGAYFLKAVNPQAAPGVSGNYGASWAHRVTRP